MCVFDCLIHRQVTPMQNYFDLLGCEFVAGVKSLKEAEDYLCKKVVPEVIDEFKKGQVSLFSFGHSILLHNETIVLTHFGATPKISSRIAAFQCEEIIRTYYTTRWYEGTDDADEMRKSPDNQDFEWYATFEQSLWLAAISGNVSLLRVLADYIEAWMKPEWLPIPVDQTWGYFLMSLVGPWRSAPLDELAGFEQKILSSRRREPKTLFKAWQAARNHNQSEFEEYLLQSVKHFDKHAETEITNPFQPLAIPQSTVMNLAVSLGLCLPQFEDRLMARLPSMESTKLSQEKQN